MQRPQVPPHSLLEGAVTIDSVPAHRREEADTELVKKFASTGTSHGAAATAGRIAQSTGNTFVPFVAASIADEISTASPTSTARWAATFPRRARAKTGKEKARARKAKAKEEKICRSRTSSVDMVRGRDWRSSEVAG